MRDLWENYIFFNQNWYRIFRLTTIRNVKLWDCFNRSSEAHNT
jgi:hypothetical protein